MVGLQNSCIELFKIANPISDSRIERRFDLNDYPLNINPFHANVPSLYLWFSDVFKGYKNGTLA